jgi:hypothetical protein
MASLEPLAILAPDYSRIRAKDAALNFIFPFSDLGENSLRFLRLVLCREAAEIHELYL